MKTSPVLSRHNACESPKSCRPETDSVSFIVSFADQRYVFSRSAMSRRSLAVTCVPLDHRGVRPAHDIHHRTLPDPEEQQGCSRRMTRVMQPGLTDPGFGQQRLPFVLIAARVDRPAVRLGEHPATLMPFGTSVLPLAVLSLAVLGDQGEQLVRQGDPAATGCRLDFHLNEAATAAIWAPTGMAGAVRRARRRAFPLVPLAVLRARLGLVVAGAAGVRIGATVLPCLPLQAPHDLQRLARLVQPRPWASR